jgi:hypothetical protein
VRCRRCPWCGGVYDAVELDGIDADGAPNEPCACGAFEAEPDAIERHERGVAASMGIDP